LAYDFGGGVCACCVQPNVDRHAAIYNIGRVAWLVNALSTSNLDNLR
jgi:hypothetical protein